MPPRVTVILAQRRVTYSSDTANSYNFMAVPDTANMFTREVAI
jgi:hypothetical protein